MYLPFFHSHVTVITKSFSLNLSKFCFSCGRVSGKSPAQDDEVKLIFISQAASGTTGDGYVLYYTSDFFFFFFGESVVLEVEATAATTSAALATLRACFLAFLSSLVS